MRGRTAKVLVALFFGSSVAQAGLITFIIPMDGDQEAPGPGDPDGFGTATLTIDDVALTVDWEFTYENILTPLTGAHIHVAPPGSPGSVVVNFSAQNSGIDLFDADLAAVLADPGNYYVNLHNADYPGGAIRGQLPEPGGLLLLAGGAWMLASHRRSLRS